MAGNAVTRVGGPTVGEGPNANGLQWIPIGTPGTGARITLVFNYYNYP